MQLPAPTVTRRAHVLAALLAGFAPFALACGDDASSPSPDAGLAASLDAIPLDVQASDVAGSDAAASAVDTGTFDAGAAACAVTIAEHAELAGDHVASIAGLTYNSNPPSSGPHCSSWPRWGTHDETLPRCNYLHGLEHGAVAVLYAPATASATDRTALETIVRAFRDPGCPTKARVVLTPDPLLPAGTTVAAATWGFTFRATCLDEGARASLARFMADHVGHGPEDVCSEGSAGSPR